MWLYPNNETFTIFLIKPDLPNLIEVDALPEGEGILRRREDGSFYYEPLPEPKSPEVIPAPPLSLVEEMQLEQLYQTALLEMTLLV